MSHAQWSIKGIGIKLSDVYKYLDAKKLIHVSGKEEEFVSETLNKPDNQSRMEYLEELEYDCPVGPDYLCSVMIQTDKKGVLVTSNNNCGEYYLLYAPHYTWKHEGFSSESEARRYIADLVHLFTINDVITVDGILALVEEYSEIADEWD